jgi:hypothetical protein
LSLRDLFIRRSEVKPRFYGTVAEFDDDRKLVAAARAAREFGYTRMDAFTPFPVHGIDEAIGIPRSPLGYVVATFGFLGLLSAFLLIWWTGAIDYPLVIGGKPLFAIVPSVPIMFELTILFSAFSAVIGMFALNKLPQYYHPVFNFSKYEGATDDRFLLAIEASDPFFNPDQTALLLKKWGALAAELVEA